MAGKGQDHSELVPSENIEGGGSELEPVEERSEHAGTSGGPGGSRRKRGGRFSPRRLFVLVVVVVVVVIAAFCLGKFGSSGDGSSLQIVSSETVSAQLERCAELTSAKMYYADLVEYESGDIPIISKSSFTMFYKATITAGIDLTDVQPVIDNAARTITVTLPAATIQSVDVDEDAIDFYKKSIGLFDTNNLKAATTALDEAEEDARADVEELGLLDEAEESAVAVVEGLLAPFEEDVYGYEVIVTVEGAEEE